jgi:hypothetical protein
MCSNGHGLAGSQDSLVASASAPASTITPYDPELRRGLRNAGVRRRAGLALVARAVDGGHTIPVVMAGQYRRISIRWREQQIRSQKLSPCPLLFTTIDAIASQVGFKINGPGKVDF